MTQLADLSMAGSDVNLLREYAALASWNDSMVNGLTPTGRSIFVSALQGYGQQLAVTLTEPDEEDRLLPSRFLN